MLGHREFQLYRDGFPALEMAVAAVKRLIPCAHRNAGARCGLHAPEARNGNLYVELS